MRRKNEVAFLDDPANQDPWAHRNNGMRCETCMFYVPKVALVPSLTNPQELINKEGPLGRCRRHAPTMGGYPAVFDGDWCGDHKLDENKV